VDLTTLGEHGAACGGEVETPRGLKGHRTSSQQGFFSCPKLQMRTCWHSARATAFPWRSRAFPDPNPLTVCPLCGVHAYVRRRRASCCTDQAPLPPSPPP
jgi:hypothetical protein